MASYTIEDIELIRRKSGITYQEAVALLDYHNGDVTRALIDLERNGKLKAEADPEPQTRAAGGDRSFFRTRIIVNNNGETIVNLSVLFMLGVLIFSPWIVITSLILCLVLGYQINIRTQDEDMSKDKLERMVRSAATSVKQTVSGFAREINQNAQKGHVTLKKEPVKEPVTEEPAAVRTEEPEQKHEAPAIEIRETPEEIVRSLEEEMAGHSAPVLQVPVRVESQDGSVRYEQDSDGYGMATVE